MEKVVLLEWCKVEEEGYYKDNVLINGKRFDQKGFIISEGHYNKNGKLNGKKKI